MSEELCDLSIQQLAPLLRDRKISPVELTDAHLARIDRLDPTLNTYICVMTDEARADARHAEAEITQGRYRGPLHGVPIGLKDLLDRKSTRLNSSHANISYAVFCLKKKK